jgi:V-type H+-transporting ATPase subunit C
MLTHGVVQVRSVVRDCAFKEGHKEEEKEELKKLKEDELAARKKLKTWAQTHFSEAYRAWMHLKTIRVFTESVLRYSYAHLCSPMLTYADAW